MDKFVRHPPTRQFYTPYVVCHISYFISRVAYGICAIFFLYLASVQARAQVPNAVTIPNPVELPAPMRRPVQLAGYAITLDQAVDWFFKQNPEIRSAREKLERARASNTLATEVPDAAIIRAELSWPASRGAGCSNLKPAFIKPCWRGC